MKNAFSRIKITLLLSKKLFIIIQTWRNVSWTQCGTESKQHSISPIMINSEWWKIIGSQSINKHRIPWHVTLETELCCFPQQQLQISPFKKEVNKTKSSWKYVWRALELLTWKWMLIINSGRDVVTGRKKDLSQCIIITSWKQLLVHSLCCEMGDAFRDFEQYLFVMSDQTNYDP